MKLIQTAAWMLALSSPLAAQEINEIKKVADQRDLLAYDIYASPNPSNGPVHVNAPQGAICVVHANSGTYVGTWESLSDQGIVLEDLPSGNYVIRITFEEKHIIRRVVVL